MPFGDRTGPLGQGPRTGRGAGFCAGSAVPGNTNPGLGRGFGRWGGGGRGWMNRFSWMRSSAQPASIAAPSGQTAFPASMSGQEVQALKAQAEWLQSGLEEIRKRIEDLEARK